VDGLVDRAEKTERRRSTFAEPQEEQRTDAVASGLFKSSSNVA